MKKIKLLQILMLALSIFYASSCGDDDEVVTDPTCDTTAATYDGDIKEIFTATCAYAGCHDGTGTNVDIPASVEDLTNFASLATAISEGSLNTRVLVDKDMPPASFVPPGSPTELTQAQLDLFQCWKDEGFPEN